jgi:hypothetical protein
MEERAPGPSRSADATSAGLRKKTRKSVVENLAVAAAPTVEAKANAVTPAQEKKAGSDKQGHRPTAKTSSKARSAQATQKKNTMAPARSAAKKTVAAPTKSAAKPSAGARRRSDPVPVIAAPVPVSQFSSRRPVRSSAAPKPANNAKRRRREGGG